MTPFEQAHLVIPLAGMVLTAIAGWAAFRYLAWLDRRTFGRGNPPAG